MRPPLPLPSLVLAGALTFTGAVWGQPPPARPARGAGTAVDRVVVRWFAPETGGPGKPQFVFARELAFEARIEALSDPDQDASQYRERHLRAALDRHVAESLLAALPISPRPAPAEIGTRAEAARAVLEQRVGGRGRLVAAAAAEGIASDELDTLLRRQARASIYLDRMIAPMLEPTDAELREALEGGPNRFAGQPFEAIRPALIRSYVGQKLGQALEAYYQNAQSRVTLIVVRR